MKKKILLIIAIIFSLLAVLSVYAFFNFPTKADGYDFSHHNKNIKWDKLDVKFVYLKATEGYTFKDLTYKKYLDQARKHGLKVGAYHFMQTSSGKKQFEHFKSFVGRKFDLIPVLDIEIPGLKDSDIKDFIEACEKYYGVKPMVYLNLFYRLKHWSAIKGCKVWISNKFPLLLVWDYYLWQYAVEKVNGEDVDHNALNPRHSLSEIEMPSRK